MTWKVEDKAEVNAARRSYAIDQFEKHGIKYELVDDKTFHIWHNGVRILYWPYTGWHTGKNITDGRGIHKLIKQLKASK